MNRSWALLFTATLLAVWNAGIVWFTQIAVYPLWPLVDASHFHDFHLAWWHHMWPSFAPVGLMFICSIGLLAWPPEGVQKRLLILGVVIQITVHALTIVFWAPIQATLALPEGMSMPKYQELMSTHWLRVAFFAAYALLMVCILIRSFPRLQSDRV